MSRSIVVFNDLAYTIRSMSRALVASALALLTALSLSTTTHANVDRVTYLHYDGLGSAIAATDEQGAIQWRENYQPYGQRTKYEATNHSVWFTGKPEEEYFALQYYGGRWYDPNLGRFNSIDPQGFVETSPMSFNRYAYGNNNPYSYVDPDGELPFLVPLAIFLVKEAAAEVASHYTDGWSDFLSVRRMATRGWRGVRNALRRNGDTARRPVLEVSRSDMPTIAENIDDAIRQGAPSTLTRVTNRAQIRANRRLALRGQQSAGPGKSLDEYPFASCAQGGAGACIRAVPASEQSIQGGQLGQFYRKNNIGEGDAFDVRVVD